MPGVEAGPVVKQSWIGVQRAELFDVLPDQGHSAPRMAKVKQTYLSKAGLSQEYLPPRRIVDRRPRRVREQAF